jgi:hypothetical protein
MIAASVIPGVVPWGFVCGYPTRNGKYGREDVVRPGWYVVFVHTFFGLS